MNKTLVLSLAYITHADVRGHGCGAERDPEKNFGSEWALGGRCRRADRRPFLRGCRNSGASPERRGASRTRPRHTNEHSFRKWRPSRSTSLQDCRKSLPAQGSLSWRKCGSGRARFHPRSGPELPAATGLLPCCAIIVCEPRRAWVRRGGGRGLRRIAVQLLKNEFTNLGQWDTNAQATILSLNAEQNLNPAARRRTILFWQRFQSAASF